jgi:YD repeat-containing protein
MPTRLFRIVLVAVLALSATAAAAADLAGVDEPRLLPTLVAGSDSSSLAAQALEASHKRAAQPDSVRGIGPAQRLREAAVATLRAMRSPKHGDAGSGASDLHAGLQSLRAASMLLENAYTQLPQEDWTRTLGVSGVLAERTSEALRHWQAEAAAIEQAGARLQVTPQAKAAQLQIEQRLQRLSQSGADAAVFANAQLPVHRPFAAAPPLQQGNAITPSYQDRGDPFPDVQDLQPSGEVQFGPGVLGRAQAADYRYVNLFDYVRSEVHTEWSVGSTQSTDSTLRRSAGNDVEQASLLIALLRASGAAARYVVGVVELPAADLAAQIGVPEARLAAALQAAGIAHRPRIVGGRIVAYQIRHTWVSARVPYGNYRGTVADSSEPTWIPLMPALKPVRFDPGRPLASVLTPAIGAWLAGHLAQSGDSLPWPALRERWTTALAALQPPLQPQQLLGTHSTDAPALRLLPAGTPYPVIEVHAEYAVLPDSERQWLQLRLRNPADPQAAPLLDARIALSELASQRFTLAFLPATVEDQHLTNAHGSLGGFPLSLVRLRPSLIAEGLPARPGLGLVNAGQALEMEIELSSPVGRASHRQRIHAGSIAGFALDAHGDGLIESDESSAASPTPIAGTVLNRFAQRYLAEWARADRESAGLLGLRVLRPLPALAIALPQVQPEGVAGLVDALRFEGVALDAALRPLEPISLQADAAIEADWMRLSALHGSALESRLFEQLWGVRSVSADSLLQKAAIDGLPVLRLQPGASLDGLSAHPQAVREHVQRWLAQGYAVQIPQSQQTVEAWTGSAWRVEDPDTGASGYFISGGYAGGSTAVPPGLWYFRDLAGALADPYAEPPNEDPTAAALIQLDADSQYQRSRANTYLDKPLKARALDVSGRPVVGASVKFQVRAGGARLSGGSSGGAAESSVLSDRRGLASVRLRAPRTAGDLTAVIVYTENGEGLERAYLTEVEINIENNPRNVRSGTPLISYMTSGPVRSLKLFRRIVQHNSNIFGENTPTTLPAPWISLIPHIHRFTMIVEAKDEYGNPVSNAGIETNVTDTYSPECRNPSNPAGIQFIQSRLYEGVDCPTQPLLLGEHECAAPERTVKTGLHGTAVVTLVPTNLVLSILDFRAQFDDIEVAQEFRTIWLRDGAVRDPNCEYHFVFYLLVEYIDPIDPPSEIARVSQPFPGSRSFAVYSMRPYQAPAVLLPVPIFEESDPRFHYEFAVEGGAVGPVRSVSRGNYKVDLTAGSAPAKVQLALHEFLDGEYRMGAGFFNSWALEPLAPESDHSQISLDEFGRTSHPFKLTAHLNPSDYGAEPLPRGVWLRVENETSREIVFACYIDLSRSDRSCVVPRGSDFSEEGDYRALYLISTGPYPLESEPLELRFTRGIVAGYGGLAPNAPLPRLETLLGDRFPRQIEIQTELDIQTDYVCQTGNRFMFALGQPARVDLEVFQLEEDGSRGDSVLLALNDAAYEEGVFEEALGLGRLPFGVYEFELRARTDDEDEVHGGRIIHREKRRGSLPLARSLVKGVDVHDGHAVISAEDIALGGRGPGLRFTRTYSSHSGDDQTLLGRGWSSDLESRVVPDSCGSYTVIGAAGQGQRYVPAGVGADGQPRFRSGNGFHGTFRLLEDEPGVYQFFSKDGTLYHFAERDREGTRLSYIEDPSGNRITYTYAQVDTERVVQRLEESGGRALELRYQRQRLQRPLSNGETSTEYRTLLSSVTGPGGLRVEYTYTDEGNLLRASRSGGGSGQRVETYAYQDFGGMRLVRGGESRYYHFGFRLTRATNSSFNSSRSYSWDTGWSGLRLPDNSVIGIPELRVQTLSETDGGQISFSYSGLRPLTATRTVVTDARGKPSTYEMNRFGATERLSAPAGTTTTVWDFEHLQPRSVTDVMGATTVYSYDEHGNRESERVSYAGQTLSRSWTYVPPSSFSRPIKDRVRTHSDGRGIATSYSYDARGRRTGQSRGGVTESFGYSANGDLSSYINGRGDLRTYGYDSHGYRTSEADDIGPLMSAAFDARGRKTFEINGEGERRDFSYDALDRLVSTRHAFGTRRVTYTDSSRTRVETDERGNATTYIHDAQGRVLTERNALGDERNFSYDAHGNLLRETDFRGNATTHEYNDANHRVLTRAPLGKRISYEVDAEGRVLREAVSGGASVERVAEFTYAHPLRLRTLERRRIDGNAWAQTATTLDANGNPVLIVDAEGRETAQLFDNRDRLIRIQAPLGRVETFEYDDADQRVLATLNTSPVQTRRWQYNARSEQVRHIDASGAQWDQGFDKAGRVKAKTDPLGGTVSYRYDRAGRLEREAGPRRDQYTLYLLDPAGNRHGVQDSAGGNLFSEFDELNRLSWSRDSGGLVERLGYDEDGRVIHREDGRSFVTEYEFNALGHETRRVLPETEAGPRELGFVHGIHGELLRETDARNNTSSHTYDGLGRRLRTVLPAVPGGGSALQWRFDAVGNLLEQTDGAGRSTLFRYNALNQRIQQTDPEPPAYTQTWTYDRAGNVLSHRDRRGIEHRFKYDGENRVIERVRDGLRIETLEYDRAGRVAKRTDARGEETAYTYDAGGSVLTETRALGHVQRWTYLPWGGVETHTDADGIRTHFRYDGRRRLFEQTAPGNRVTEHRYDAADNRVRTTRSGPAEWKFEYDADKRLTEVISPESHRTRYVYDKSGNRIRVTDAEGFITTTTFDARNRAIAIDHPVGGNEGFEYNGAGELIAHTDRSGQRIEIERDGLCRERCRGWAYWLRLFRASRHGPVATSGRPRPFHAGHEAARGLDRCPGRGGVPAFRAGSREYAAAWNCDRYWRYGGAAEQFAGVAAGAGLCGCRGAAADRGDRGDPGRQSRHHRHRLVGGDAGLQAGFRAWRAVADRIGRARQRAAAAWRPPARAGRHRSRSGAAAVRVGDDEAGRRAIRRRLRCQPLRRPAAVAAAAAGDRGDGGDPVELGGDADCALGPAWRRARAGSGGGVRDRHRHRYDGDGGDRRHRRQCRHQAGGGGTCRLQPVQGGGGFGAAASAAGRAGARAGTGGSTAAAGGLPHWLQCGGDRAGDALGGRRRAAAAGAFRWPWPAHQSLPARGR